MDREDQLKQQLCAIYEDSKALAAPILAELAAIEALKPPRLPILCAGCLQPINPDWLFGTTCACSKGKTDG